MALSDLLKQFAKTQGLDELAPEPDGSFRLEFEEGLAVSCFATGEEIFLVGDLGGLPSDPVVAEERMRDLLHRNLAMQGGRSGGLSLDPTTQRFVLTVRLPARGTGNFAFEQALEGLLNDMEQWVQVKPAAFVPPMHMLFP